MLRACSEMVCTHLRLQTVTAKQLPRQGSIANNPAVSDTTVGCSFKYAQYLNAWNVLGTGSADFGKLDSQGL